MLSTGKAGQESVTLFQFSKLARVPGFSKVNQFFKADLDICFKNAQRRHEMAALDIHAFFEAIENLAAKIYKDEEEFADALELFLDNAIAHFEGLADKKDP